MFAALLTLGLFMQRVVLPPCTFSEATGTVSSVQTYGKLMHGWGKYVVQDAHGNEVNVAECHRNCPALYHRLKKEPPEAPAYTEFCGPYLTFLSVNQHPLYTARPPTQSRIDEMTVMAHWTGLFALLYLVVIIAGSLMYTQKKSGKRRGLTD